MGTGGNKLIEILLKHIPNYMKPIIQIIKNTIRGWLSKPKRYVLKAKGGKYFRK
jgi:hypothetical protein